MIYAFLALIWFVIAIVSGNSDYWIVGAVFIVANEVYRLRDYFECEEAEDDV